jgi:thiamine-monophosphate kinase
MPGEFDFIRKYFAPLAISEGAFGLTDDAAQLGLWPRTVVTADAMVEGVHYFEGSSGYDVARKLLRVNLSDLAAKGARPLHYLLTAGFRPEVEEARIKDFVRGLRADQKRFGVMLAGGDTVSSPGREFFSITMIGEAPKGGMVRRGAAKPGDLVFVTGTIGDSGAWLKRHQSGAGEPLTRAAARFLEDRHWRPEPRLGFGAGLHHLATAAVDVSDGLLQDLGHIARASKVSLDLTLEAIPLSRAYVATRGGTDTAALDAVGAGEDYEIAFTAPKRRLNAIAEAADAARTPVTCIGVVGKGSGVRLLGPDGKPVTPPKTGWNHFGR